MLGKAQMDGQTDRRSQIVVVLLPLAAVIDGV